jgi:DNA-binding response OmpR family regulator
VRDLVLVIHDDELRRRETAELLRTSAMHVLEASDLGAAERMLGEVLPDAIVVDLVIAREHLSAALDGWARAGRLVPTVVVSDDPASRVMVSRYGITWLTRTLALGGLVDVVRKAIEEDRIPTAASGARLKAAADDPETERRLLVAARRRLGR